MKIAPISILVAEDHSIVREGLVSLLNYQDDMRVVGQTGNGHEAVRMFEIHRPDILLIDLGLPGMMGADVIAMIVAEHPAARFVVLTTYDGDADIYRALEAGAQGYLLKDCRSEDLLTALREVHAGGTHIPPEVATRLAQRTKGKPLSAREVQVISLMAHGKANKEIAAALAISEGTVKTYALSIFEKLGVVDRTEAVVVAMKRGVLRG